MISKNEVKYIQSLYHKKNRQDEGVFIAEGPKLMTEIFGSAYKIRKIYAIEKWAEANSIAGELITVVTEDELQRLTGLTTANQVLAVLEEKQADTAIAWREELILMVDGIQDPGNFGTIIRIADWFGIQHIIASMDTVDVYNPKVIQATMGSFTRVNIIYETLHSFLSANNVETYAAVLDGTSVNKIEPVKNGCIIIGNEGKGISDEVLAMVKHKITIPRVGHAESLNAAVATGIILSHLQQY
jgi:TrmH family RNA methyltransferase